MTSKKTELRANDILKTICVIEDLMINPLLFYNGVAVSETVRIYALHNEIWKLRRMIGIKDDKFQDAWNNLEWDENSPEMIEFNDTLEKAVSQVLADAKNDN